MPLAVAVFEPCSVPELKEKRTSTDRKWEFLDKTLPNYLPLPANRTERLQELHPFECAVLAVKCILLVKIGIGINLRLTEQNSPHIEFEVPPNASLELQPIHPPPYLYNFCLATTPVFLLRRVAWPFL